MPTTSVTAPDGSTVKVTHPDGATEADIIAYAQRNYAPESDEQGLGETATRLGAGLATEIAIGEAGRIGGAAAGTAIFPGIGTGVGYIVGGLGSGAAGSIARQRIMDPDGDISWGEVVADSLINLIPGGKAAKGGRTALTATREVAKRGAISGLIGGVGETAETLIDEQRLPTLDELKTRVGTSALLGAGFQMSGEAFKKAYAKFAGMPSHKLTDAFRAGDPDAKLIVDGLETTAKKHSEALHGVYKKRWDDFRQAHSDELTRARELQSQSGGGQYVNKKGVLNVVADEQDYYMQRRLAESTIQHENKLIANTIDLDKDFLSKQSKALGKSMGDLSDSVDDYLYAKHAISYNKQLGDGAAGIDSSAAQDIVSNFERANLHQELATSVQLRTDSSRKILDVLVDGGLVSPTVATALRKKYPDYVPLNRVMGEADIEDQIIAPLASGSTKYEATGTGLRKAKGSEREVRNITQNIYENLAGAVRRAEVNKANLAFKKLLETNPDQSIVTMRKPKVIGYRSQGGERIPIMEEARNNVLTVYDTGQKTLLEFSDPDLARVFKGANKQELGQVLKASYAMNRFVGGLLTRWNPGFLVPNLVRDRVEATINNLSKMKTSQALRTLYPVDDAITIERNLRGIKPRNPQEVELDALYGRFQQAGGSSGGLGLSTVKHIEDEIAKMAKSLRKPPHQLATRANNIVNGINEVFEDSTRFGTFRRGIASGMTDKQAALAARNSSFDPLLKGSQGDTMKALWMFSNPALQSVKNFTQSMSNPKVGMGVMAGLMGTTMAIDRWNQRYDKDWREKLKTSDGSNWKTNKNLVMVYGTNDDGTLNYTSIPVGYSVVPFKVMAERAGQILTGQKVGDPATLAAEVSSELIDAYNPMGGSIVPTPIRPFTDLAINQDGLGRDIRPEWLDKKNMSATEKVYPWTAETYGGELAMSLSEDLASMGWEVSPENLLYLYRTYTGGPGNTVRRLFDVTSKLVNNQPVQSADIPVARRFFGQTYAQAFERRNGQKQIIQNIDKQENTDAAKASRIAYSVTKKYRDAGGGADGMAALSTELRGREDVDEAVLRRVLERVESDLRGITYTDRELQGLGVDSGARAKAYLEILQAMEPSARMTYLQEQIEKGILSAKVQKQLAIAQGFMQLFGPSKQEAPAR